LNSANIIAVFIGGGLGSVLRFLITFLFARLFPAEFPYGTLTANYLGCFTIGILMAVFTHKIDSPELKLFFVTGMMGGLTTFSTFSYESVMLFRNEEHLKSIINLSASLFGCLFLTLVAYRMSLGFMGK
jgi:CrcB protein